jgi:ABC-type lipoprotein release transport system permease subunit
MKKKDASFSVGFFLATRDLKHSNPWTTLLIIFVMSLTFVNMILIGGILLGLAEGMVGSFKQYYSSDLFITPTSENMIIEETNNISVTIETVPTLESYSKRIISPAKLEYGYRTKIRETDIVENVQTVLVGIDPISENAVSNLSKRIIEGKYLDNVNDNSVLMGKNLFDRYSNRPDSSTEQKLKSAGIGSLIKIIVGKTEKEVVIKGIIGTDNNTIDSRIFMMDSSARSLMNRSNLETSEIAIKLQPESSAEQVKFYLENNIQNIDDILLQTADEAVPGSSADITRTFSLLGNLVGAIALIVGAITIFIVIFVNAITRRKYIGILKGIGISARAIEISYVLQSLFYAVFGILFASLFLMGFLKPFLEIHPLILPIAEGRLAVTTSDLIIRGIILIISSLISGFIPARLVTKQNTLDSILGK